MKKKFQTRTRKQNHHPRSNYFKFFLLNKDLRLREVFCSLVISFADSKAIAKEIETEVA